MLSCSCCFHLRNRTRTLIGLNRYIDHCVSSLECTDSCALVVVCYSVYKACVKDYKDSVLDGNHSNPITARITNLTWANLFVFSFLQNTMNSGVQGAWALTMCEHIEHQQK